jgi:hypothetical protein
MVIHNNFNPDDVVALRDQGMSIHEIATHLKVSYQSVWKLLSKMGKTSGQNPRPGFCRKGHDLSVEGTKLVNKGPNRTPCWICVRCDRERRRRRRAIKNGAFEGHCPKGHSTTVWGGPTGCRLCAQHRAIAQHRERRALLPPAPPKKKQTFLYSWQDYADAVERDFAKPHWLREAPAIREYLIKNNVTNAP